MPSLFRTLTVAILPLALLLPFPGATGAPTQVPCGDPRGCPDLIVDSAKFAVGTQRNEFFSASSCAVQEGMVQQGTRQVLRFTFTTPNIGRGDLKVGSPSAHPEWFVWAECHGHFHFKEYADYRLWTVSGYQAWDTIRKAEPEKTANQVLAEHPELVGQFVAGNKAGFCIIDIAPGLAVPNPASGSPGGTAVPPDPLPKYLNCNTNQGISRGWADEYLFTLDGQWVDVTNVAAGAYMLESEVNAERLYVELDYANNRAVLPVVVT